jgi:hypothetical protein
LEPNSFDPVPPEIDAVTRNIVADEEETEHEPDLETSSLDAVGSDDDNSTDTVQIAPGDKRDSVERDGMYLSKYPRLALSQKDLEDSAKAEDGAPSAAIDPERSSTSLNALMMKVIRESAPPTLRVRPDQNSCNKIG